ncbi:radical SAM protein [Candidatus Woesearchaeota archaeon]|nr:radical SAM protein [Candidatus Woesearchaeota archaeon]
MGVKLEFKDIAFSQMEGFVRVYFLKYFYFDIDYAELHEIAEFSIKSANTIEFQTTGAKAERQFQRIVAKHIETGLKSLKGSKAIYVHQPPIVGSLRFGLIDRDTNLIEVRPITGCNLNCIYCSIDEGIGSEKIDYVVDKDLLLDGFKELAKYKKDVEAHIGPQGEPLMYAKLLELIEGLSKINNVNTISIDTNGVLMTKEMVDMLAEAGLTRVNLSMNAMDAELAKKIAGCNYNVEKIMDLAEHIAKKMDLLIAPVYIPGINDAEIPKLIQFAKKLNAMIGIQNFLEYKGGRNPVKQKTWEEFYAWLEELENEYGVKLKLGPDDFNIVKQKTLQKPFRKNDIIKAEKKYDEFAEAQARLIKVQPTPKQSLKVKITRDKHNIYFGTAL